MRALVWNGPYDQAVREAPDPEPRADEVLLAPELVGICGSDVTAHKGRMGIARPGSIRGHEFGGVVVRAADGSLEPGTRVTVDPVVACGVCAQCRRGRRTACPAIEIIGVHRPGALAELVTVPAAQIHVIPDDLSWAAAASVEPLAQAFHDVGLARFDGRPLGDCLVIGGGSIGSGILTALRGMSETAGAPAGIMVVDTDRSRHEALRRSGADRVIAELGELGDHRFDTVFDAVGVADTRRAAIAMAAGGGAVVAVGLAEDEVAVSWFDLVRREIAVLGANTFLAGDFAAALAALGEGRAAPPVEQCIVPLDDAGRTFADLAAGEAAPAKFFVAPQR